MQGKVIRYEVRTYDVRVCVVCIFWCCFLCSFLLVFVCVIDSVMLVLSTISIYTYNNITIFIITWYFEVVYYVNKNNRPSVCVYDNTDGRRHSQQVS